MAPTSSKPTKPSKPGSGLGNTGKKFPKLNPRPGWEFTESLPPKWPKPDPTKLNPKTGWELTKSLPPKWPKPDPTKLNPRTGWELTSTSKFSPELKPNRKRFLGLKK